MNKGAMLGTVSHRTLSTDEILSQLKIGINNVGCLKALRGVTTLDRSGPGLMVFIEKYSKATEVLLNKQANGEGLYILCPEYANRVSVPAVFTSHVRHIYTQICLALFEYQAGYWDLDFARRPVPVVGPGTTVMPGAYIASGAQIGRDCLIFPGVYIGPNVRIGDHVVIKSNTVIGQPGFGLYRDPVGIARHMPHVGSVVIGDYCEFGALNTICSGTIHPTRIDLSVLTGDHVHIAHNCHVGAGVQIAAHADISANVRIENDVWLSPNSSVNNDIRIGASSFVGIGANVTKSVPEAVMVVGNPARKLRNICKPSINPTITRISHFLRKRPRLQRLLRWLLLNICASMMRLMGYGNRKRKSVLYVGQALYNAWYLSRALRKLGWNADVLNWDTSPNAQIHFHGEDFRIPFESGADVKNFFRFYFRSLRQYDVFHFSNMHGLQFGWPLQRAVKDLLGEEGFEIRFLKALGKKIVYSNNGCQDGVSQTAFSRWGPESTCSICSWQHKPRVCSDERNLAWGKFRNEVADYQCLLGGNRVDYNDDPRVHEVPEFYCLDTEFWHPQINIPEHYRLSDVGHGTIRLYHAVANRALRTRSDGANMKSTHVYLPLVDRLRAEGHQLELIYPTGIHNKEVRYLQAQADIVLDMLTFGWYGANVREAMMLGKPVICFLRPEWLHSARQEIPDYVDELPIVSATPQTVEAVLRDLIANKEKRLEIGRRSRAFAVKWHSDEAGARRFDQIYLKLLGCGQ